MTTYFISDLHLQDSQPALNAILQRFLRGPARAARELFILGDLFEAWVGDDCDDATGTLVATELRALSDAGVAVSLMHGNRDFLLGQAFAERCGARLLPDPTVIELGGITTLLSHGDAWCTDDVAYQAIRRQFRDPAWQAQFLAQPLAARQQFARQARAQSAQHQQQTTMELMDVNPAAIESAFRLYGVERILHGHTHRPAEHCVEVDNRECLRWVLADWREQGEALAVHANGRWERLQLD